MLKFQLDENQILSNWTKLQGFITRFSHRPGIEQLYSDIGERMAMAPASTRPQYHNSFPGGYVEHVLRVIEYSAAVWSEYKKSGMDIDGFTKEELLFAALNHDLGKMGMPGEGNEYYIPQKSDWHIKNRDQYYEANKKIPFLTLADGSLYLLQHYGVQLSFNEWHAIRVHDGPLEDANTTYFKTWADNGKFQTNLPYILMEADVRAMRYEYLREMRLR